MADGLGSPFNNTKLVRIAWLVRELGITTVVILVFLGLFIGWVKSPMTETHGLVQAHVRDAAEDRNAMEKILRELVRAQQVTCINQAKDESQRGRCIQ